MTHAPASLDQYETLAAILLDRPKTEYCVPQEWIDNSIIGGKDIMKHTEEHEREYVSSNQTICMVCCARALWLTDPKMFKYAINNAFVWDEYMDYYGLGSYVNSDDIYSYFGAKRNCDDLTAAEKTFIRRLIWQVSGVYLPEPADPATSNPSV